jgi:outer membrane protein assembly factor BamD (BamD/ComL family)
LYAAGLFDQFRSGCQRAEGDRRYSAWQPQILYLEWVAERKLGNTEDGDRRRDIFLSRYPGHALAAGMYFEQAMRLLADGQYDSAKRRLATIVDDFPQSNIAREAQVMLGQLDAVALSSGQR